MGTDKIDKVGSREYGAGSKKLIFIIVLFFTFPSLLFSQTEYVQYDHQVYDLLERLDAQHVITNYNSFEKPKTRRQIAGYLIQAISNLAKLSYVDKSIIDDFKIEFEYELYGTLKNSSSILNTNSGLFSQKEKYLYFAADSGLASLFINFASTFQNIPYYDYGSEKSFNASYLKYGGILRGTFLNKFGYYIKASNGKVWGDRTPALTLNDIKFSYKYNIDPKLHSATDYVDFTEGYLTADFEIPALTSEEKGSNAGYVRFKIGRDTKTIGYGPVNFILGENIPAFDYLALDMNYGILNFSYLHGKLLGNRQAYTDSVQGAIVRLTDKYFAYHRFGINISRHFSFGFGETVIYSNRSIDFSYLNPFNFYKSVEHANQDRDNSMLFLDFQNNSFKGLKFSGAVLIDDIDFSKIGTSWFGNQLLYNFNVYSSNLFSIIPVDFHIQYFRAEPYIYTHRIHDNSYTTQDYSLASPIMPNSDLYIIKMNYYPHHRIKLQLGYSFSRHGANPIDENGILVKNVGGDVLTGHREFDSVEAPFLAGNIEYLRSIDFRTVFEPINNYYVTGHLLFENNSLQRSISKNFLAGYVVLDIRL